MIIPASMTSKVPAASQSRDEVLKMREQLTQAWKTIRTQNGDLSRLKRVEGEMPDPAFLKCCSTTTCGSHVGRARQCGAATLHRPSTDPPVTPSPFAEAWARSRDTREATGMATNEDAQAQNNQPSLPIFGRAGEQPSRESPTHGPPERSVRSPYSSPVKGVERSFTSNAPQTPVPHPMAEEWKEKEARFKAQVPPRSLIN
jgi:hypothetical protein